MCADATIEGLDGAYLGSFGSTSRAPLGRFATIYHGFFSMSSMMRRGYRLDACSTVMLSGYLTLNFCSLGVVSCGCSGFYQGIVMQRARLDEFWHAKGYLIQSFARRLLYIATSGGGIRVD